MSDYLPINCTFHDRLEHWSILKKSVTIVYLEENQLRETRALISDVFAQGEAEFACLTLANTDARVLVRLDRIVSVEGITLASHC